MPTTTEAWALIKQPNPDAPAQKKIAHFCQALAQRVLVIRAMALSEAELELLTLSQGAAVDTVAGLRAISDFHRLMDRCGDQAGSVLDALQAKTLSAKPLAQALNLAPETLTEALKQAGWESGSNMTWQQLAALPAWLDLAQRLQITPAGVGTLLTLSQAPVAPYGEWSTLAALLLAGLTPQQSLQVQQQQDQRLGEALSGDYRTTIMAAPLEGRDDIWRRLLVDGQVSAEVTTTRLAEAIASVQLYINRTLAGQEPGADRVLLARPFFKDWARYNKGYSTWAGVSQLAYYPENTIDPTLRIGQSGMMDAMLQQLAQSQLNSDTLEEGFHQYLTAFEQVANLKVASGYHDHPDIHQGNTWFIGYSQSEPRKYYWRSLDHSKGQDGRFAANAWSEWREIACAITPYQGLIRPVIYRSRLYVLWVEEQQRKTADGKQDEQHYALKLSHIHYDGSWASPFSFDITADLKKEKVLTPEALGLYSAANFEDDTLTVAFYQKRKSYQLVDNKLDTPHFGIRILADMTRAASTNIGGVIVAALPQLDTTEINRVNNALGGSYQSTLVQQSQQGDGLFNLALTVDEPYISQTDGHTSLVIYPMVEVMHTGKVGDSVLPSELQAICEQRLHEGADIYLPERQTFTPKNGWPVSECCLVASKRGTQNGVDERIYLSLSSQTPLKEPVLNLGNWILFGASFNNGKTIFGGSVNNIPENKTTYQINSGISTDKLLGTLDTGDLKNILADFKTQDIVLEIYNGDTRLKRVSGSDVAMTTPESNLDTMVFAFGELGVNVSDIYKDNQLNLTLKVTVKNTDGVAASTDYALTIKVPEMSKSAISLHTTDDGAQYMELDCYRTRLNTLFAQQLIARASRGVDAVLSRETQSLMEPKLGKGTYVTLTLAQYDKAIHGSDRRFSLQRGDAFVDFDIYEVAGGTLSLDAPTEVKFFIPQLVDQKHNLDRFFLRAHYQSGNSGWIKFIPDGDAWKLDTGYNKGTFPGLLSVGGLSQQEEPMDFSGANALYFWELFYYTPMMVASRLLQEQDFSEANRWLRYVWDPADGTQRGGVWNTRPLDEDTTWNADPLDSVDPDAIAQHDPMHYKMSTVMRTLDLLIARGDAAYRLLERDTLNEAKMWYVQALTLLGEKPFAATGISWATPALGQAADSRATSHHHRRLSQMRSGEDAATPFSANSLIGVFLPQQNEKLLGYWQTLEQRLYNLRHHLAIDGQPLSLPIFATPADPAALLSAAAGRAGGGRDTATGGVPALRFPAMLDNAKAITGQLSYFGSTLLGLIERQDAEAMSELLQNQASELMVSSLRMQQQTLAELDAERAVLQHNRVGVQSRFDSYQQLYQENVSAGEQQAMNLSLLSSSITISGKALHMAAAVADTVPNIYGLAVGGSRYGALFNATAIGIELGASATRIAAERIGQSEAWRRRRQEWEIQRNNAEAELKQLDAQLEVQAVRRQAAEMQQAYLQTQQTQSQAQLEFLQRKFSNKALYSWLRSRLTAIYFQFYDLTASRCMMAQAAWQWQTGGKETFIKPGAWQSTHAGLLCGESLQLNLAQMEAAWLKWNRRALEVTRTVSLAGVYRTDFVLTEAVKQLLTDGKGEVGSAKNGLKLTADHQLQMAFNIADLNIAGDYPAGLGKVRRIKQISVTLPALVGPYQDVRAVLSYGGSTGLPDGCQAIALSHGMNDSGQFQLDFNDERWLPFEGIALEDKSSLTLSFPGATDEQQKALLLSLSDVIVHIHYTIR
ncbi:Uncharacterised protein [Serratia quinivorans]|nr:Uncharacterised protein [Serratia quinivorans]